MNRYSIAALALCAAVPASPAAGQTVSTRVAIAFAPAGLPAGRLQVQHFRVDQESSNAREQWKKMGSPAQPDAAQYQALERAGQLQLLESPRRTAAAGGRRDLYFSPPRQGVSLAGASR